MVFNCRQLIFVPTPADKGKVNKCLEMIEFGMGNTLLTFWDKYYKYGTLNAVEDKRLTIGGYESAWLADLVAAFVLEHTP